MPLLSLYSILYAAAAAAKSLQSCPTLWDPMDSSPPVSPVSGILQARTLEWVAISFSNAWKGKVKVKSLSRVQPSATPWTAAHQAPPSMGFSRQEYWSGCHRLLQASSIVHCYSHHLWENLHFFLCFPHPLMVTWSPHLAKLIPSESTSSFLSH